MAKTEILQEILIVAPGQAPEHHPIIQTPFSGFSQLKKIQQIRVVWKKRTQNDFKRRNSAEMTASKL